MTTQAISPLGTPEQRDAEQTATETANTLPVQLTKLVLKTGWYVTALGEFSKVGGPDKENLAQLSRSVDEYAMGAAFQQQLLNPMTPRAVMQVAPPHTWYGQTVGGSRILYDNPDTIYRFMAGQQDLDLRHQGQVRKLGRPGGKARGHDLQPADRSVGKHCRGCSIKTTSRSMRTASSRSSSPVTRSRPGYEGNYLQLTSDSTLIAARDTLADWNNEQPMSLSIERISGPPNSLLAQFGIFAIPLIGPAVSDNPP